jgi:C-methyltransferase C-terminal domain/Putative zinc binding domain/Methyltransferase domain
VTSLVEAACRHCGEALTESVCDLGMSPLSNSYVKPDHVNRAEVFYPLHALVCSSCLLVQLEAFQSADHIFSDEYAYFSSYSSSWLAHCKSYTDKMVLDHGIGPQHLVVELASNDGYLLQYFHERGIPVLGVEPTANTAAVAIDRGVPTRVEFFGAAFARQLVSEGVRADLLLGNNVLAHVPDLNDFVQGMSILLADDGFITMEFPHLMQLMRHNQFDTIYQEHFCYFSLLAVQRVFASFGLRIFDVEQLGTHGGSLRIFACHDSNSRVTTPRIGILLAEEQADGLHDLHGYRRFADNVRATKRALLRFLIDANEAGKSVVGYGAPAKGNTLLNYCGVSTDLIEFTVDRSPHKQGLYLPGVHIPIKHPDAIVERRPDYVLVLPWNLKDEIMSDMAHIRSWGGQFVLPIPTLTVVP